MTFTPSPDTHYRSHTITILDSNRTLAHFLRSCTRLGVQVVHMNYHTPKHIDMLCWVPVQHLDAWILSLDTDNTRNVRARPARKTRKSSTLFKCPLAKSHGGDSMPGN